MEESDNQQLILPYRAPQEHGSRYTRHKHAVRMLNRPISEEDVNHSDHRRAPPPRRRKKEETLRSLNHLKFLQNWDGVSSQFSIPDQTFKRMSALQQQYWRVKCMNMNGMVIVKHHLYCYLFFTEEVNRDRFWEIIVDLKDLHKVEKFMPKSMQTIFRELLPVQFEVKMTPEIFDILFSKNIPCIHLKEEENVFHHMKKNKGGLNIREVVTPAIHPNRKITHQCLLAIVKDRSNLSMVVFEPITNEFFVDKVNISSEHIEKEVVSRILMRYTPAEILVANDSENQVIREVVFQMAQYIGNPFVARINILGLNTSQFMEILTQDSSSLFMQQLQKDFHEEKQQIEQFSRRSTVKVLKLVHDYLKGLGLIHLYYYQGFFSSRDEKRTRSLYDLSTKENNNKVFVRNNCLTYQGEKMIEQYFDYPLFQRDEIKIQQCVRQILGSKVQKLRQQNKYFKKLGLNLGVLYHLNSNKPDKGNIEVKTLFCAPNRRKLPVSAFLQELNQVAKLLRKCQEYFRMFQEFNIQLLCNKVKLVSFQEYSTSNKKQGVPLISDLLDKILRKDKVHQLKSQLAEIETDYFPKFKRKVKKEEEKLQKYFKSQLVQFVGEKYLLYVPQTAAKDKEIPFNFVKKPNKIRNGVNCFVFQVPAIQKIKEEVLQQKQNGYEQLKWKFYQILEQFCQNRVYWFKYVEVSAWIDGLFSLAYTNKFTSSIPSPIPLQNQQNQLGSPNRPSSIRALSPRSQLEQQWFPKMRTEEDVKNILEEIESCFNEFENSLQKLIKQQTFTFDKSKEISARLKRELKQHEEKFQQYYNQIASLMTKALKLLHQNNLETDVDLSIPFQKGEDVHGSKKKNNPFEYDKSSPSYHNQVISNITQLYHQLEKVDSRQILNMIEQVKKQTIPFLKGDHRKTAEEAFRQLETVLSQRRIEKNKEERMFNQIFSKLNNHIINQRYLKSEWQKLIEQNDDLKNLHQQLERQIIQEKIKLDQLIQITKQKQQNYNKILAQVHEKNGNLRVFCRVRPRNPNDPSSSITVSSKQLLYLQKSKNGESIPFNFDRIFQQSDQQEVIFQEVEYLVQASVKGKNICIFCYGQTGTGKSHTMIGQTKGEKKGIIPRSVECIFDLIKEKKKKGQELNVSIQIKQIHIDILKTICEEKFLNSNEEALSVISKAIESRFTSHTEKNHTSSRSHFILTLCLKDSSKEKIGSVALIDLAGSERYSSTKSAEQELQGKSINTSLLSLKEYLKKLNQINSHRRTKFEQIQYEQLDGTSRKDFTLSKQKHEKKVINSFPNVLVTTLKPILERNCVALIFVNVSPDMSDVDQTKSTLVFGQQVKNAKLSRK